MDEQQYYQEAPQSEPVLQGQEQSHHDEESWVEDIETQIDDSEDLEGEDEAEAQSGDYYHDLDEVVEEASAPSIEAVVGADNLAMLRKYGAFWVYVMVLVVGAGIWGIMYKTTIRQVSEKEELYKDLRNQHLQNTATLINKERISEVEKVITERGLDLEHSTHPPYYILDTLALD